MNKHQGKQGTIRNSVISFGVWQVMPLLQVQLNMYILRRFNVHQKFQGDKNLKNKLKDLFRHPVGAENNLNSSTNG